MADNREDKSRDELTEEASPHRIEESRNKGQVAQSREVTGLMAMLATGIVVYVLSPKMGLELSEFMREVFRTDLSSRVDLLGTHVMADYFLRALRIMAGLALPVAFAGFVVGILGSFVQIGAIFSTDPLTPDIGKINPLSGLKRMFSMRQLTDGIRLIFKMTVVIWVSYTLVKHEVFNAPSHYNEETHSIFTAYAHSAKVIFLTLTSVLALFAAIDLVMQRLEYSKQHRMTKQEAKQEHREREGDPQIKARIRAVQREVARRRMMQAVRKADVIITNPTHIAIAISYEKGGAAPKVIAKGADFVAQKIKKVAAEAGVPLVENVPLARTLYKTVKINQYIPRALYQAVAEVLAYVYRLKKKDL